MENIKDNDNSNYKSNNDKNDNHNDTSVHHDRHRHPQDSFIKVQDKTGILSYEFKMMKSRQKYII